jgi:membrane protease YdiL (CAAX protease family)
MIRRHPLTAYVLIAFAFSWIIEAPVALAAQGIIPVELPAPTVAIAVIVATFGPTVGAFAVTAAIEGRRGVLRMLRRYVQWRAGIGWYLFVLVGIPAIIILATLVVPGAVASYQPILGSLLAAYPMAFLLTVFLGGPLGEEPGWRGFALPRLQDRFGPLRGSLLLGVVWAAWHLPLFWSGVWTPPTVANVVTFTVMIVALTVIMTWVYNHTAGSLLIMILMHASFNTFANRVAAPLFPAPILDEYGLLPVLIGFTVTALVLIAVTRGRLGAAQTPAPVESLR